MGVTTLKQKTSDAPREAPFQSAMSELTANELIFAVVGPVGSGTSEIAEALEGLLKPSYDVTILKARTVIEDVAQKSGINIPQNPKLVQSTALQNAGDSIRAGSKDNAAIAVGSSV
jgi:energy-coupling factor transporter ATP-binding protein EcfA2